MLSGAHGFDEHGPRAFLRRLGLRKKFSILFYAVTFVASALIGGYGYSSARDAYLDKARDLASSSTTEIALKIEESLKNTQDDLDFIATNHALLQHSYWMDLGDVEKKEYFHEILVDDLRGFVTSHPRTAKARVINPDGREHIVVRRDPVTREVRTIPDADLQDQSGADYFVKSLPLAQGQAYTSPVGLAVEHGRIVMPAVPVIRLSRPIFGDNKVRYGVMVLNIFADALFDFIREAQRTASERKYFLVDGEGEYFFHEDPAKTFGKLLGTGPTFERDFPGLLARMGSAERGTLSSGGRIFSFHRIAVVGAERSWILVGMVAESDALGDLNTFEYLFGALALLMMVAVLAASRYILDGLMRPLAFVTNQLERLGRGEVHVESYDYSSNDEIGAMLESSRRVMVNMERLAVRTDAVGRGELEATVELLSSGDRLGSALNRMIELLRATRAADQRRAWLKDGLEELARALAGDLTVQAMASTAIALLGRRLGAGRGVFYVPTSDGSGLELLGSYMYTERATSGGLVRLGEGSVGQVAREGKPIILTVMSPEVPPVQTGTSRTAPLYTYTWPIMREGALLGVLEVSGFERFADQQLELLNEASELLGSFVFVAQQRQNIGRLLAAAEASDKEAREQSRHLAEANARLEEQQHQLRQQTAELQAANTQMEQQQRQLRQQTAELQAANAQMEEQRQQLEKQNLALQQAEAESGRRARDLEVAGKYKSEFLANMSHELRTPLNSIILLAKMMASNADQHLGSEDVKRAEVIHTAGLDLLRLINDVLDLSKVEAGKMELDPTPVASSELAEELRGLFADAAAERGLELAVEDRLERDLVIDRAKVSQILRNLLSNALKFTRAGKVTVTFAEQKGARLPVRIAVRDTGIGIPKDKQDVVFEAFRQADGSTSREYGGTGLGLSISRSLARLMGGEIELESTAGVGSEFTLALPASPRTAPAKASGPSLPARPAPRAPTRTDGRADGRTDDRVPDDRETLDDDEQVLLLVDDDPALGRAVLATHRRLGYKTLVAGTGAEGLELARRFRPNGILLDLGLPDMDGTAVLHELKRSPELARIPVYVVSARDRDERVLEAGAVGYLKKPVDADQIARAESEVLAAFAAAGQSLLLLERGGLEERELTHLVEVRGGRIVARPADAGPEALREVLSTDAFGLAILDLGNAPIDVTLALAEGLRTLAPDLPILFYGTGPISDEDVARLGRYSDSIIVKTARAGTRLQDNIARFLADVPTRRRGRVVRREPPREVGQQLNGRRVLVVDDDARNLFVLAGALEASGAKVDTALNGRRALARMAEASPHVVIMDIMMPDLDGLKTIEAMRRDPRLAKIPVLALTAKALPSDRDEAIEAGADDYLTKPVEPDVLINLVAAWCEGRR